MIKRTKKVLLVSLLIAALLNGQGSSNNDIDSIIRESVPQETRREQRARERAEREKARAEEKERREEEKKRKELEKINNRNIKNTNKDLDNIINNEINQQNNQEQQRDTINNRDYDNINNNYNNNNTGTTGRNSGEIQKNSQSQYQDPYSEYQPQIENNTQNVSNNKNVNEIIEKNQQAKTKHRYRSKIDRTKPVVIAEDREKETPIEYKEDMLMKYIATKDGKIIKAEHEKKQHPIASLTKVMNILVAFDEIDKGNAKLEDNVCFTPDTANIGGSWLNVKSGDCFMLRDLLRAEIIYSANNAAYLVAKHIGKGNIDNFVKLMNEKAKKLGMENTVFYTPAGLPTSMTGKGMDVSTAYDMYLLGREALNNQTLIDWSSEPELIIINAKGEQVIYPNRNHILGWFGINGLKTGFHNLAGFNLIVTSKRGNIEVVSVVLGHKTSNQRNKDQRDEFVSIWDSLKEVYSIGQDMGQFKIKDAKKKEISGILSDNIYQIGDSHYEFKTISTKTKADKDGVKKGDVIGKLQAIYDKKVISEVDILAAEDTRALTLVEKFIRFITFGLA